MKKRKKLNHGSTTNQSLNMEKLDDGWKTPIENLDGKGWGWGWGSGKGFSFTNGNDYSPRNMIQSTR